jgi:signal transduction histidine kinase
MRRELAERVFDPFFTTKSAEEGTGLGLSVASDIVRAHGGEIVVESEPGKGTVFQVLIPLYAAKGTKQKNIDAQDPPRRASVVL